MTSPKSFKDVVVYHVGARENYNVSKAFRNRNWLKLLITDYNISKFSFFVGRRRQITLPKKLVASYTKVDSLINWYKAKKLESPYLRWMFIGKELALFTRESLQKFSIDKVVLWGYTGGCLEVLQKYRDEDSVFKIVDQVDPGLKFYELDLGWGDQGKSEYLSRIQNEWQLADLIIVNSVFSKQSLIEYGVVGDKIAVVPLICETVTHKYVRDFQKFRLKVGFAGNINHAKGFDLFLKIAKRLADRFDFVAAGNIHYEEEEILEAKQLVNFTGYLDKTQMQKFYEDIDIFIFPTRCDGFGQVQIEALSFGVPVIASPYCAKVVVEDESGYVCQDWKDIATKIEHLNMDRAKLKSMSFNAIERATQFNEDNFFSHLLPALESRGIFLQG